MQALTRSVRSMMEGIRSSQRLVLMAGESLNRGGRFILLLLVAREVGAEQFGAWVIALATATFLANAADAGLITAGTTEIASGRIGARKYLAGVWGAAPLLGVAAFALVLALSPLLTSGTSMFLLLVLSIGGTLENMASLVLVPLRAHERFGHEGTVRAAQGLTLLIAGGPLALATGGSAIVLAAVFLGVGVGSVLISVVIAVRAYGFPRPEIDFALFRGLVVSALPALGSTLVFFLYFRIDAYLLTFIKGDEATGLYGAAYNVAFGASFLPLLFGRTMLSRFAAVASGDELRSEFARATKVTAALALGLSLALAAATPLFVLVYGGDFVDARTPYLLLVAAQGLYFFNHLMFMLVFGRQRAGTAGLLALFALAVNVAANLVLIGPLGPSGAALGMILSEALLFVAQLAVVRGLLRADLAARVPLLKARKIAA